MLEIIKSYFDNKKYYVLVSGNYLYVKNYKRIISIDANEILLIIGDYKYIIEGENIRLNKKIGNELSFVGNIFNVTKYDID